MRKTTWSNKLYLTQSVVVADKVHSEPPASNTQDKPQLPATGSL